MKALCLVAVVCAPLVARAQTGDYGNFLNLSVTGDGKTPSAVELAGKLTPAVSPAASPVSAGATGDASWSLPLQLPPARHAPQVGLSYGSGGGPGVAGRGFAVQAGITIHLPTGAEARAYTGDPGVFVVSGAVDGLLMPDGPGRAARRCRGELRQRERNLDGVVGVHAANQEGQEQLEDILTDPDGTITELGRGGVQVSVPDGRGARVERGRNLRRIRRESGHLYAYGVTMAFDDLMQPAGALREASVRVGRLAGWARALGVVARMASRWDYRPEWLDSPLETPDLTDWFAADGYARLLR